MIFELFVNRAALVRLRLANNASCSNNESVLVCCLALPVTGCLLLAGNKTYQIKPATSYPKPETGLLCQK
jgi:hypothetical protein